MIPTLLSTYCACLSLSVCVFLETKILLSFVLLPRVVDVGCVLFGHAQPPKQWLHRSKPLICLFYFIVAVELNRRWNTKRRRKKRRRNQRRVGRRPCWQPFTGLRSVFLQLHRHSNNKLQLYWTTTTTINIITIFRWAAFTDGRNSHRQSLNSFRILPHVSMTSLSFSSSFLLLLLSILCLWQWQWRRWWREIDTIPPPWRHHCVCVHASPNSSSSSNPLPLLKNAKAHWLQLGLGCRPSCPYSCTSTHNRQSRRLLLKLTAVRLILLLTLRTAAVSRHVEKDRRDFHLSLSPSHSHRHSCCWWAGNKSCFLPALEIDCVTGALFALVSSSRLVYTQSRWMAIVII